MTLTDKATTAGPRVTESGAGRPVLALGADFADAAGFQALARRFRVFALTSDETDPIRVGAAAADWIAASRFEKLGVVGIGAAAGAALAACAAAGEAVDALVLVSPQGLPLGEADGPLKPLLKDVATPKCVLIGDRDAEARQLAAYRTELSRSHVVLVFDAGPDVVRDRPDAFASAAGDFLDRQGRFNFVSESVAISA